MERRNLKVLRIGKGLTQEQMAERLEMARSTYSQIESGRIGASRRFARKLQEAFMIHDEDMWALLKKVDE